ncbi:MAG TPA: NHL repeat-containing protein [Candidatus Ozemobacteraceae bacterium]|nr:NHL repeat-containing protein [Candidatus Ozemobacteraceae bacterium]
MSNRAKNNEVKTVGQRISLLFLIVVSCLSCGCGSVNPHLSRPNLIVASPDGKRLVISDSRNFRILVVDRNFRVEREIRVLPEQAVWGLNLGPAGELLMADTRITKATFDSDEKRANAVAEVFFMGLDGVVKGKLDWLSEKGPVVFPRQVLPLPDGGIAITDLRLNKVFIVERNGTVRLTIGEYGANDGQLYNPSDILADTSGKLLVVDSYNHRIVEFSAAGAYLRTIGRKGTAPGELLFPQNIARDENGRIYCTELGNMRVSVFEADGRFVRHLFMPPASGSNGLNELFGIAFATAPAELYVADSLNSCIHVFDSDGRHRATVDRVLP